MNDLYAILLSWAVTLSGYSMPDTPAEIVRVPHDTLVRRACGGRECKVMGWFPPGQRIYIDERLGPEENLLAASIVVHEMVHYLQYRLAVSTLTAAQSRSDSSVRRTQCNASFFCGTACINR